jgi:PP-loop superfamily ATP-utilizing enzyme
MSLSIKAILEKIEILREELYRMGKDKDLLDLEILRKSQQLDKLIAQYYHLENKQLSKKAYEPLEALII